MINYNVMSISFYVSTVLRKKFRLVWNSNSYFAAFFSHLPDTFAQYCILCHAPVLSPVIIFHFGLMYLSYM